jgi:hypothetical protein
MQPPPASAATEPEREPTLAPQAAVIALEDILDTLGAAHHCPFSR